jgi:hypothetical protein
MIRSIAKVCIAACFSVPLISCGSRADKLPDGHELAAQVSPDRLSRAFVWGPELGGGLGATVSQPYQVWLQSQQGEKQRALILEADKTDGVRLAWKSPGELEICYGPSQIIRFRNFFVVAERDSPQIYKVEILLRRVSKLGDC